MAEIAVRTERGKACLSDHEVLREYLERINEPIKFVNAPRELSPFDCTMTREGKLVGIAELKCRDKAGSIDVTLEYVKQYGCMINAHKFDSCCAAARELAVPFKLYAWLKRSDCVLAWTVIDGRGLLSVAIQRQMRRAQATVNSAGADIDREVVIIAYEGAKVRHVKEGQQSGADLASAAG